MLSAADKQTARNAYIQAACPRCTRL